MDTAGFLMLDPALCPIPQADTGYIQIMAGHGLQIIHGDGLLSTMAVGLTTAITDGFGYRATPGDLHG